MKVDSQHTVLPPAQTERADGVTTLDTSRLFLRATHPIANNSDCISHAAPPQHARRDGGTNQHDFTNPQPTATIEEIQQEVRNGSNNKLALALQRVYPGDRPYVQDFCQLISELATKMIKTVPDEMKHINPNELVIHLVDRPSVNAYVIPSTDGAFSVFIHRGLLEEFLVAPELKAQGLIIDALAGVVAHEICHTNFKRNYKSRGNTMVQEEYCDLLPAKMLERSGFRPEAMSALCDLFARINNEKGARAIDRDEPHATSTIRKEIYEKGAWGEFEKARRKDHSSSPALPRAEWEARLESIAQASKDHRIISFIENDLIRRGAQNAPTEKKLTLVLNMLIEHKALFDLWHCSGPITEAASVVAAILKQEGANATTFAEHPCLTTLSTMLYKQGHHSDDALRSYKKIAATLQQQNFGVFTDMDAAIKDFLQAANKEAVRAAISSCEKAFSHNIYASVLDSTWGDTIFPEARGQLKRIFPTEDFTKLREGQTIPFPFAPHRELADELLALVTREETGYNKLDTLHQFLRLAGVAWATSKLLGRDLQDEDSNVSLNPADTLKSETRCGSLAGFSISQEHGITMLYPSRVAYEPKQDTTPLIEAEKRYAQFVALRGATLIEEASKLTHDEFFSFTSTHAYLIMPQMHPVGIFSGELTRSSHKLAETVMARFSTLVRTAPSDSFRSDALDFITKFKPMTTSPAWDIYRDYHSHLSASYEGARVDPSHPLVEYILKDPDQLLSRSQQLLSITALNAFHGFSDTSRFSSDGLKRAFSTFVGGDNELAHLFAADYSQPPELFIANLVRLDDDGPDVYRSERFLRPHIAVREMRAQMIRRYLDITSPEQFTLEQLHTLYDLCSGGDSRITARHIGTIASNLALKADLSRLKHDEFIDSYHHLVCMGATDRSVQLETACNKEIMRRYKALPSVGARGHFLDQIVYPKTFSCGEPNVVGASLQNFVSRNQLARINNPELISSVYIPRMAEPSFERFIVEAVVAQHVAAIRTTTGRRYDDRSSTFLDECQAMLTRFDEQKLPTGVRAKVLQGVADELLLQRESSFLLRDNLHIYSKIQSRLTFADAMAVAHKVSKLTNSVATALHNGLIGLRSPWESPLRESLFRFFLERTPDKELPELTRLLADKLKGSEKNGDSNIPDFFKALGIVGVGQFSDPEGRKRQEEIIDYHLRGLHQRFSELDVKSKGAALSVLAVDNEPSERSFKKFKDEVLLPCILPKEGPYNKLLLSGINDYFEFYGNALHHKYMVACGILAAAQEDSRDVSDLAKIGLVAKNFLGAHGTAGYKLLQRIRNHPSTPQEIKDVLHNVLDETISLPRWTIHERIEEFGPPGANQHWVGKAKAGSMCLSVPLKKADGTESFLSLIHPGAHVDSLYWLTNFTTMASNLSQLDPRLGVLAPMAQQTKHLIKNETDFASSPAPQQSVADRAYNFTMRFSKNSITVTSSCAPLISAEAKPHPNDFMLNSGNKEAGRVAGKSLLEMVSEFREKVENKEWSKVQAEKRFAVLQSAAFSVLANEIRLIASCQGKDHDRHPGNYLIEVHENGATGDTGVHLNHFDFGCTDITDPSETVRAELGATLQRFTGEVSLLTSLISPSKTTDKLSLALFEKGTFVPEIASIPLGLLAATGANEKVRINGEERALLSGRDMLRAVKVGLESAKVPIELASAMPSGIKGWLLKQAYKRIDTEGITIQS